MPIDKSKFGKKTKDDTSKLTPLEKKMYKILPKEPEEERNPRVALYNDIIRHAMVYDTSMFSRHGITDEDELYKIFNYALDDYPEIFWINTYSRTVSEMRLVFRCLDGDGNVNVREIESKRAALKRGAKKFTKGITRKTKPYDALVTIYRRLILTLDYDGRGLDAGIDEDRTQEDKLRSLYSAIVEHKVVCAGYAVAIQYLLQTVGISCGCVTSESTGNSCHAFNALKIGKYCYYLDATWGDYSNTKNGSLYQNEIRYDYCCVPLKELQMVGKMESLPFHTPKKEFYPKLEEFRDTNHEYFRFRKCYLTRFDEDLIVNAFANAADNYDEKEMGRFSVSFRCSDLALARYVSSQLNTNSTFNRIISKASAKLKKRSSQKILKKRFSHVETSNAGCLYVWFN